MSEKNYIMSEKNFNYLLTLNELNASEKPNIKENKWSKNSIFSIFKSKYFFLILYSR